VPIDGQHLVLEDAAAPREADPAPAPPIGTAGEEAGILKGKLRELERLRVAEALAKTGGNQSHAAKLLGISRYTLMSRMEEFGMARPRKRAKDE
jgi:DNA-binding NtrC family response regulator